MLLPLSLRHDALGAIAIAFTFRLAVCLVTRHDYAGACVRGCNSFARCCPARVAGYDGGMKKATELMLSGLCLIGRGEIRGFTHSVRYRSGLVFSHPLCIAASALHQTADDHSMIKSLNAVSRMRISQLHGLY